MIQYLVLFISYCYGNNAIDIDINYMENEDLYEFVNSEYAITQKINNATFYLTISPNDIRKYIFLEIYFSYPKEGDINFITTIGINQLTSYQNSTFITTYADYNGYKTHKDYHYIIVPPNSFKKNDTFYITNLIRNDRRSYQYLLKISRLDYQPCPRNCYSNSGNCINGICSCNENKIDIDCSKDAIALKLDLIDNITLNGVQYFYFEQETKIEQIQFKMGLIDNFEQYNVQITLDYMFEDFIYGVPFEMSENYTLSKDERIKSIIIDISQLNYNANLLRFQRLLFKIITKNESLVYFEISNYSSDNTNVDVIKILMIILISLASIFLILIIGCIINKYKNARNRNILVMPQCFSESQSQFTEEFIKKYMIQAQKGNYQCSICLQNENSNEFILTPCQHPFHIKCLLEWLNNQKDSPSCPNCRGEIDFKQIKIDQFKVFHKQKIIINSINQSTFNLNQEQAQN